MKLPTLDVINKALAERSLYQFVKQAWHVVEPGRDFADGRHIAAICELLERCNPLEPGGVKEFVINIPPRHMKSLLVAVLWPVWLWGPRGLPQVQFLFGSYSLQLAMRDNLKRRRLIQSPWYQGHWADVFQITTDQNAKTRFENNHNGHCLITSPDSAATGEGGDVIVVDDPHNVTEARSEAARTNVISWWNESMSTRVNNPKTGIRGMIAQRVHELDLCGHCLEKGTYTHLCLPARFEPEHPHLSDADWREEPGELLWPDQFSEEQLRKLEIDLGSYGAAGQLQQRPAPAGGGIIKREWIKYWDKLPDHWDMFIQSWDMAFKDTMGGSYVVGQVWGKSKGDFYLVDQFRERCDFPHTQEAVKMLSKRYPQAHSKLVEDKANGPAIIASLGRVVSGLIPVQVTGSKEARAAAVSPFFESGNVYLPHTHWIEDYVHEICTFPNAANDDQMDTTSQALERLSGRGPMQTATTGERTIVQGYTPR